MALAVLHHHDWLEIFGRLFEYAFDVWQTRRDAMK